jgi:hypothetical protein
VSYFGGLGAGKGWNKLHFFIDDTELKQLLSQEQLRLLANGRVRRDYQHTSLDAYLEVYRAYLKHLSVERSPGWNITGPLFISLTQSTSEIVEEPCPDLRYKLLKPVEPVISLSPLEILYMDQRLWLDCIGKDTGYLGLSMAYPRVVSYRREGHEVLHDTSDFVNAGIYQRLTRFLTSITRPCTLDAPNKTHRTRLRISAGVRPIVAAHPMLREHGLKLR